ncbi:hypothetical protein VTP01DRAFT_5536 [Rhizomucor pusillus]|uniref:uncharacterized protein n=1 Tax=Rhizomucor pusillus TaxID=4840 RepID=UPI00374454E0
MGGCVSCVNSGGENTEEARSRAIDKQIREDQKQMKTQVKLLLLAGAGESGKSTILKQMKLIHASGFTQSEREVYRVIVLENVVGIMRSILEAMDETLNIPLQDPSLEKHCKVVKNTSITPHGSSFAPELLEPLKRLWDDQGVQEACKHGNRFALHDNASYFYSQLDRLWEPDYLPTNEDIIRCRAKSTGIIETDFQLGPLKYRMFDVGGQRSERKKWIHCFENVTAVIFVVAISGYDQCLIEDRNSNHMVESLMVFDLICNSPWFINTSIVLFLNKIDVFKEKIKRSPISKYFPDYAGPDDDFEQARAYFRQRFLKLNRNQEKRIYTHYTDATDTNLLQHVMVAVSDTILNENLNTLML